MKKFIYEKKQLFIDLLLALLVIILLILLVAIEDIDYRKQNDLQSQIDTLTIKVEILENSGTNLSQSNAIKNLEKKILVLESEVDSKSNPDFTDIEMKLDNLEERIIDLEEE